MTAEVYYNEEEKRWKIKTTIDSLDDVMKMIKDKNSI